MNRVLKNEDEIARYTYDNNIPYIVTIELLTKCNLKCKHCYIPEHDNDGLEIQQIRDIFSQLKELGTFTLVLTGGEIFCKNNIFEIIELARQKGFRVILYTNATLLDEEKIKKLKELSVYEVSVSLYSLNENVYEEITGVKGSFRKAMKNIDLMSKYGINVEIKMPIMKDNKDSYEDVLNFSIKHNFSFNANTAIFCKTNGDKSPCELRLQGKDFIDLANRVDEYKRENERFARAVRITEDSYVCASLRNCLGIDCEGNVYPCSSFQYKLGNITANRISDIKKSEDYKKIIDMKYKDLRDCLSCEYLTHCDRCPGMAYLEDEDLYGCSSSAKDLAVARYEYNERR